MIRRAKPIEPTSVENPNDFLQRLQDLADDPDYAWASDTIIGISETVTKLGRVSAGQRQAIDNIAAAVEDRPRWRE